MATPLTTDERKQRQYDILWNTMSDNELLPYSAVSSLTKQLNTANKSTIKAINELLTKLQTNDTTVGNFSSVFNTYIGNTELDIQDWNNLKLIDTNVIKAIYKLYLQIDNALKIQGKAVPAPTSTEDGKALVYDLATDSFKYASIGAGGGGTGDMAKAVYDTNNDGKVDTATNAEKLGDQFPTYYSPSSHNHDGYYLKLVGGQVDSAVILSDTASIVPANANMVSLGSPEKPFKDVYVGPNTLYINGNPVLSSSGTTVAISTSIDEHLSVSTSGLGTSRLASAKEVILYSGQVINIQANDDITTITNGDYAVTAKGRISLTSDLTGQNIVIETKNPDGTAHVNLKSTGQVNLTSADINFSSKPKVATVAVLTETDSSRFALATHTHAAATITGLGTVATKNTGIASGEIPILDANGKLDTSILPAIAITNTSVVADEVSMLALTAQVGDIAIRSDLSNHFILKAEPASVLSNWQEMLSPSGGVLSVNGKVGAITLTYSDVDAAAAGHTHSEYALTTHNHDAAYASITHNHAGTYANLTHSHAWGDLTSIPAASTTASGIVQLSTAVNSVSTSLAATSSSVKAAYDLANGKANATHSHAWADITKQVATTSVAGVVQLSDSVATTSSILAATPTAVKAAYDLASTKANVTHNHDGVYASATHNHDTTYVRQDGASTMTGPIKSPTLQITDEAGTGKFQFVFNATTGTLDLQYIGV